MIFLNLLLKNLHRYLLFLHLIFHIHFFIIIIYTRLTSRIRCISNYDSNIFFLLFFFTFYRLE
ncbi:hypothetical protein QT20_14205 [Staphylococcus aureus]|nr:hypothetical protein QT20_14205 [Staphylococcus aureus]PGG78776.1 hypothetical protein CRU82_06825 [Staphylococcus aureus]PGG89976.1 hypothetical protein CRU84_06940 [Staphylococcus aureus]